MTLRVVIAQVNLLVGDIEGNARQVIRLASRARDEQQADLIVFPELTLTSYPPEDLLLRPECHDRIEKALTEIISSISGITVVIGYPRSTDTGLYNMAGVFRDGDRLGEYSKWLLPNYSVFDEKRYFSEGDKPLVVDVEGIPVGITICEDSWFSEPTAAAAAAGAKLVLNLNASPFHTGKPVEREELVGKRSSENGIPIVYCNLVGGQDELVFDGGSFVTDAAGSVCARAPFFVESQELIVFSEEDGMLEPEQSEVAPHADEEVEVYQALVLGVRDYVNKNGFKGAVLGLSGGIDSALTLAIAVDALGAERVEVVLMPSRYTADMSNEDAAVQADKMGVLYRVIPIEPAFRAFLGMLEDEFAGLPEDTTEENIQARCRGIILMALSNKTGKMLLTTGNKSEMSVGYATLYGDMAGGYAPIKDVPKTLVYRLAEYRNQEEEVIPRRVIERPPSAELRPDQVDTDSLPDYEALDSILWHYVVLDHSVEQIVADGHDEETVRRITGMVDRNEYKRRQAPPGVRITRRAFGRDRRYPITNGF
ncbi:NAD+ synthase [Solemya velum gill symbiont]|uniref:NAD+ synthase n=1 Tax=Solemya velum gill symbiont TaxID=2340 RepID=UPI000998CB23|nr:NAD+ synthase [Solemya velum gill symbiont]OOZ47323.1 NAD+ synthase [Solemya velum gill symbiont]OOZ49738.1 NAD+ synthase [Solemya velum gill symbiont]OOZ52425.1 NAD+ synthase [Solemya velum gill symbiont]OOZ55368.1 NAD+ synthase [Solemya velum gill symbiont]OOZ56942.1 NAD+ synthase [Solemya velum gill symbiont]